MYSRRDFLKSSSMVALAPTVPAFLAQTARAVDLKRAARILVVVQLEGGNDGINTVVPFADEGYAKHRKTLRLAKGSLVKVNDTVGLHPSLGPMGKLLEAEQLSVVQGVSYPNPNRSHFRSMAIWHSARLDPEEHGDTGWLGRGLDQQLHAGGAGSSMFIGSGAVPVAIRGRRSLASSLERPEEFAVASGSRADNSKVKTDGPSGLANAKDGGVGLAAFAERSMLDAYVTADRLADLSRLPDSLARYPDSGLGRHLRTVARLIKADFDTRVYYTVQSGYDTHSSQLGTHRELLFDLANSLKSFLDDLAASKLAERVAVLLFSEFGRTVAENGSAGTDHGTSGPVFLAGPGVKSGVVGKTPSLLDLDPKHGDLKTVVDFRQVYAGVLEDWLGLQAEPVLGEAFAKLPLFRR